MMQSAHPLFEMKSAVKRKPIGSRVDSGGDIEVLERRITYRFGLIASRMTALFASDHIARHGLSVNTWRVLAVIARYEPLSGKDLAALTQTDPYKITRVLTTLLNMKLVSREIDPEDRRRIGLRVAPAGRSVHDEIARAVSQVEHAVLSGFSLSERATLYRLLDKLDDRVLSMQRAASHDSDRAPMATSPGK